MSIRQKIKTTQSKAEPISSNPVSRRPNPLGISVNMTQGQEISISTRLNTKKLNFMPTQFLAGSIISRLIVNTTQNQDILLLNRPNWNQLNFKTIQFTADSDWVTQCQCASRSSNLNFKQTQCQYYPMKTKKDGNGSQGTISSPNFNRRR